MGHGSYTAADWAKLKASRGLGSSGSADQTFKNRAYLDTYNARFVEKRESFDSEDSPESTPIIFGFDDTGSMGYLAQEIATNALNETIQRILTTKPVTNPHMLCAAFADPNLPLQVTQFEADIRVVEQLLDFYLCGSNLYSYDTILWYFAAKHTVTDCFTKRGQKGILIGIGDEICEEERNILKKQEIASLFGDKNVPDLGFRELLGMAQERYDVAHIVVGGPERFGNGCYESYSGWRKAMPGRVAKLPDQDIECLADVIVAMIRMMKGTGRDAVLAEVTKEKREIVASALEDFDVGQSGSVASKGRDASFSDRLKQSIASHHVKK